MRTGALICPKSRSIDSGNELRRASDTSHEGARQNDMAVRKPAPIPSTVAVRRTRCRTGVPNGCHTTAMAQSPYHPRLLGWCGALELRSASQAAQGRRLIARAVAMNHLLFQELESYR